MSSEILAVLEYMEKEKGISRDDMIATIEGAVKAAAERGVNKQGDVRVEISPKTGAMQAWTRLEVVESVSDTATEIHVDKARLYADNPQVGDFVERELDPAYLGRIAARTAEQAIKQRLRQFEKEHIYDEFRDQVGGLVTGIVRRKERGDLVVEVGKAEAASHRSQDPQPEANHYELPRQRNEYWEACHSLRPLPSCLLLCAIREYSAQGPDG